MALKNAKTTNLCEIFTTEYRKQFIGRKQAPAEKFDQRDYLAERIEDDQIDPRTVSIPTEIDETARRLVANRKLDLKRSVYQVAYKNHWDTRIGERSDKQKFDAATADRELGTSFESELLTYVRNLYFNAHEEKVLAPPATAKRVFGYARPKLLHGGLSMYQETYGRTGGMIMLENMNRMSPTGTANDAVR